MIRNLEQITQRFSQIGSLIARLRWGILIVLLGITVIAALGLRKIELDSSFENSLLKDDPLLQSEHVFEQIFGNNEYVGVLVEAEDVFAPDILRLIRELGQELEQKVPYADKVVSLTDLEFSEGTEDGITIRNLVPDDIPTSPQAIEAIRALAFSKPSLVNRLFSEDSTQTWINLRLHPYDNDPASTRREDPGVRVGQAVLEILDQETYRPYTLKPSGVPVADYQERVFFNQEANTLILLSVLIAVLVLFLFLQTVQGIIVPILSFISSVVWVFGVMGHLGIKVNSVVMTLPIYLGLAVSIGYSIHIFNFFKKSFLSTGERRTSVIYAIQETGWPILFTAATTIAALASFFFVPIRHIRWMGFSSAAVIIAVYFIVMTLTPSVLSFGKDRRDDTQQTSGIQRAAYALDARLDQMFVRLSQWIYTHSRAILIIFIVVVLGFLGGVSQVYISMNFEKSYGLKIPYVKNLYYVGHAPVGAMYSYEVILSFDEADLAKSPSVLERFNTLSKEVQKFPLVNRVSSLLDIIKDMNQVLHDNDPEFYRVPDDQELIAQLLLLYEISNGADLESWVDYEYTTLRLMVEVSDFDTGEVEREIREIRHIAQELFPEANLTMVGTLMKMSILQNYIAKGEVTSSLIALVVIGILMMLVFQNIKTGLIGMIPNIAPVLVVLGTMGYLEIPIDMTTMVIIPILLGLAVDDTIHFITHSKLEFERTRNYRNAIQKTFRTVGKAIFTTSFILIASFSAYMTSVALFFVHLALVMSVGVLAALLADYFITPILVIWTKPFGSEGELTQQQTSHLPG